MAGSIFSTSWYRVANLKPRLRSHAAIHRHRFRGQTWYLLHDRISDRFHRFSPAAYFLIGLMDGQHSLQSLWELANTRLGDQAPTQDEMIQLVAQLHAADAIRCETPPDVRELLRRHEQQQRKTWQRRLLSFFAWQFPLLDPERFLQRSAFLVRPFVSWGGAVLWLAFVIPAVLLASAHWSELSKDVIDRVMTPQNLLLIWLLFPVIKILHEFGHAFAVKVFGGEVHEMGVMLLVFTPVPYVDASASWSFANKWHRAFVGAAGMAIELVLAALAMFVWVAAEPGTIRTLAYNTMLIAGVSTLIFNGNPLLRFDGYYILSDVIEIPNLRQRGQAYLGYLCERYLFGRSDAEPPIATTGERVWFVGYTIASFVYRALVVVAILLFLTEQVFIVGVLFALATALTWTLLPIGKGLAYLVHSPRLRKVRFRAFTVSATAVGVLAGLLLLLPVPFRTRAEGVVWVPEEAIIRPGVDCFVERVVVPPGTWVSPQQSVIQCRDQALLAEVEVWKFRLEENEAKRREQVPQDLVKAEILREEHRFLEESFARAKERADELHIRSRTAGKFVLPDAQDLPHRFVKKGQELGYVMNLETVTVRTIVGQTDIDLIRYQLTGVDVRLAERIADSFPAELRRLVPAASEELPSPALGSEGGGQVPLDPTERNGKKALQKMFQLDLGLGAGTPVLNLGGRVWVRFDHGWAPLAWQWYRSIRQLFLSRFHV